jgi:peptidoglycan/LPS O-acetylase OafA/YrhL
MSMVALPLERHQTLTAVPSVLLYVGNWWMVFGTGHSLGLLSPCWSLAVEEQFYVLWPLLAAVWLARTSHRLLAARVIAFLAILDCLWNVGASHIFHLNNAYMRTDTHGMGLLAGSALAMFVASKRPLHLSKIAVSILRAGGAVAVLVILVVTVGLKQNINSQGIAIIIGTIASTALVAQLVLAPTGPLTRFFGHPMVTWFGQRSYGIYLFNYPISVILPPRLQQHNLHRLVLAALGVSASIAIAAASYRWVEQPFLRYKARFTARQAISVTSRSS